MQQKRLYKSNEDKAICGVCGGLAEYFGIDSLVVRLLFVLFTLAYGIGVLFYIIAALCIPARPIFVQEQYTNPYANVYRNTASSAENVSGPAAGANYVSNEGVHYENKAAYSGERDNIAREAQMGQQAQADDSFMDDVKDSLSDAANNVKTAARRDPVRFIGLVLIVIGALLLIRVYMPWVDSRVLFAGCVIVTGLYLVMKRK